MQLRPVNKRVLVEQVTETVTDSGLILEEVNQEVILKGVVVDFSEDLEHLKVSIGQSVYFNQTLADRVKVDGVVNFLVKEEDVLAILTQNKK